MVVVVANEEVVAINANDPGIHWEMVIRLLDKKMLNKKTMQQMKQSPKSLPALTATRRQPTQTPMVGVVGTLIPIVRYGMNRIAPSQEIVGRGVLAIRVKVILGRTQVLQTRLHGELIPFNTV